MGDFVKNRILAMRTEVIFRIVGKDVLTKNKEQCYFCFIKILPTPTPRGNCLESLLEDLAQSNDDTNVKNLT